MFVTKWEWTLFIQMKKAVNLEPILIQKNQIAKATLKYLATVAYHVAIRQFM